MSIPKLKTGMRVTLINAKEYVVLNGTITQSIDSINVLYPINAVSGIVTGVLLTDLYDSEGTSAADSKFSIAKIEKISEGFLFDDDIPDQYRTVIWERKKEFNHYTTEMLKQTLESIYKTVKGILKELGDK